MTYLLNSLSLNMAPNRPAVMFRCRRLSAAEVSARLSYRRRGQVCAAIGHADTAAVVNAILCRDDAHERRTVVLAPGDIAFVAQYSGPRLPEGATALPEGAAIEWWQVWVRG